MTTDEYLVIRNQLMTDIRNQIQWGVFVAALAVSVVNGVAGLLWGVLASQ